MPKTVKAMSAQPATEAAAYISQHRARHLSLGARVADTPTGKRRVMMNEAESPLAWLARRRGRDGRALITECQFLAGERLRADFTRAQLMPRTTADWSSPIATARRSQPGGAGSVADGTIAARQRVNAALEAVGPEFSGLLIDLCCFLKGLEDIETARAWPARSAKVVLQLALDRLARHYGYTRDARGPAHAAVRTWLADGAEFQV